MNSTDATTDKQRLIVVGNGMVGHNCIEQLLAGNALAQYRIEVFGEEAQRAYDRVHLSEYFGGRDAESLAMSAASLYEAEGLTLHLGCPVLGIDREAREVITANGSFGYDKLVLATGSYPWVPPIQGSQHHECFVYRTIEDLKAIRAAAKQGKSGITTCRIRNRGRDPAMKKTMLLRQLRFEWQSD